MRHSPGKDVAREYFYRACLHSWLTPEQLASGAFLVLLGQDRREIPYLEELGVHPSQVWCVERDETILTELLLWGDGQYHIHGGSLERFLTYGLHGSQRFAVLNLDIEGTYVNGIDPSMTSVLLYTWRNPDTVLATYASIGRDPRELYEGYISLALLLALVPEATERTIAQLTTQFHATDFTAPTRMVLRELFWLRSILEHTLRAVTVVGDLTEVDLAPYAQLAQITWDRLSATGKPVTLDAIRTVAARDLAQSFRPVARRVVALTPRIARLERLTYRAQFPWSMHCTFFQVARDPTPISVEAWCTQLLATYADSQLVTVNREGETVVHPACSALPLPGNTAFNPREKQHAIRFSKPRVLAPISSFGRIRSLMRSVRAIQDSHPHGAHTTKPRR